MQSSKEHVLICTDLTLILGELIAAGWDVRDAELDFGGFVDATLAT